MGLEKFCVQGRGCCHSVRAGAGDSLELTPRWCARWSQVGACPWPSPPPDTPEVHAHVFTGALFHTGHCHRKTVSDAVCGGRRLENKLELIHFTRAPFVTEYSHCTCGRGGTCAPTTVPRQANMALLLPTLRRSWPRAPTMGCSLV